MPNIKEDCLYLISFCSGIWTHLSSHVISAVQWHNFHPWKEVGIVSITSACRSQTDKVTSQIKGPCDWLADSGTIEALKKDATVCRCDNNGTRAACQWGQVNARSVTVYIKATSEDDKDILVDDSRTFAVELRASGSTWGSWCRCLFSWLWQHFTMVTNDCLCICEISGTYIFVVVHISILCYLFPLLI